MAKTRARSNGTHNRRKVALALQGGGAYGAFTWGVLDLARKTADQWFRKHGDAIGRRSTIDLQQLLPVGA